MTIHRFQESFSLNSDERFSDSDDDIAPGRALIGLPLLVLGAWFILYLAGSALL